MKLAFIPILSLILLAFFFPVLAKVDNGDGLGFSAVPYQVGESLSYNVSYSNFPSVAHVQVQVVSHGQYAGRDAFQLHAHVETTEIVNVALLALDNEYNTFVDAGNGQPIHSQVISHEGSKSNESSREFSQVTDPSGASLSGTYDFLSAFYRLRALPLSMGESYSLALKGETDSYTLEIKVTDRQSIKTSVGSYNSIVAQARISGSLAKNAKIYFSDDPRHVPVLLTAKVGTGELRVELSASELLAPTPIGPIAVASPTPTVVPTPTPSRSPNTIPVPGNSNEDWPFKVGEQLNYQIFIGQNTTSVGGANFQVRGRSRYFERDGLWLSVRAQTLGPLQRVFNANDQIDSYVDPKSLLPYRTDYKLIEGKRRLNQVISFNQDSGSASIDRGSRIDIPVGTHDYISFFFAVRTFNLNPNKRNAISILVENKPKTLFVTALKKETIQLSNQRVAAILLTLTTDDLQSDKYQIRMWVSDDRRRLPLRITFATEIGPAQADLAILPTTPQ